MGFFKPLFKQALFNAAAWVVCFCVVFAFVWTHALSVTPGLWNDFQELRRNPSSTLLMVESVAKIWMIPVVSGLIFSLICLMVSLALRKLARVKPAWGQKLAPEQVAYMIIILISGVAFGYARPLLEKLWWWPLLFFGILGIGYMLFYWKFVIQDSLLGNSWKRKATVSFALLSWGCSITLVALLSAKVGTHWAFLLSQSF